MTHWKAAVAILAITILVIAAAILRRPPRPERERVAVRPVPATKEEPKTVIPIPVAAPPPAKPGSAEELAKANDDARIKATYQNFRAAVATKNTGLQDAILPILLRDRKTALKYAEDDLAKSTDSFDQDVTQQTVDALRR